MRRLLKFLYWNGGFSVLPVLGGTIGFGCWGFSLLAFLVLGASLAVMATLYFWASSLAWKELEEERPPTRK